MVAPELPSAAIELPPHRSDHEIAVAIRRLLTARRGVVIQELAVSSRQGIVTLRGRVASLLVYDRAEEIGKSVLGVRALVNEIGVEVPDVPDFQLRGDVAHALQADPVTGPCHLHAEVLYGRVMLTGTVRGWVEKQLARRVARGVRGVRAVQDELTYGPGPAGPPDDAQLVRQIREMLNWDSRIAAALIGISAYEGRVTLTGAVGSAREWNRAIATCWAADALSVDAHQLHVAPWLPDHELRQDASPCRPNGAVAQAVRDALRHDPRVRDFEPQVLAQDGTVTLSGTVGNLLARRAAEQAAHQVAGVRHVNNGLRVHPLPPVSDAAVREEIRQAFTRDPYLHGHQLHALVEQGYVTLTGGVDSRFEVEHAEDVIAALGGVVGVQNGLHFPDWRPTGAPPPSMAVAEPDNPGDEQLRHAIETHLQWEAQVSQQPIGVMVEDGCATLHGTVRTWHDRHTATRCALEEGATHVDNQLHVL